MTSGVPAIRVAVPEDIPALCGLLGVLFAQESEFEPRPELQRAGLERIITGSDMGAILVASVGGQLVGMVNLLFTVSTALGARVALLEDMVVLPAFRSAGVGKALLGAAVQHCRDASCARITLLTDHDNHSGHRFYERAGFERSSMVAFRLVLTVSLKDPKATSVCG